MGTRAGARTGDWTESVRVGDTIPAGFAVAETDPPRLLSPRGRHRLSRYELRFELDSPHPERLAVHARTSAVFPGVHGPPDTAVVTKNVLVHGRRTALGTSLGVSAGLLVWTLAAAVGIASVVRASEVAFTVLKLIGALYLVWLGVRALRAARHAGATPDLLDLLAHADRLDGPRA